MQNLLERTELGCNQASPCNHRFIGNMRGRGTVINTGGNKQPNPGWERVYQTNDPSVKDIKRSELLEI